MKIECSTSISKKILSFILAFFCVIFFPYIACHISDIITRYSYNLLWLYIHHMIQMILALVVIILPIWKKSFFEWGFNINEKAWSLRTVLKFGIGWFIIQTIMILVLRTPSPISYSLNFKNIVGDLVFDFVLTGISEEILFRALAIGILIKSWKRKVKILGFEISTAGFIAAILFSLAHIGFTIYPFQITYVQPMQLAFAFGLGIFYAVMFEKTGSLLGPILAHGASDGLITVIFLILKVIGLS